jgi:hypothetical protein
MQSSKVDSSTVAPSKTVFATAMIAPLAQMSQLAVPAPKVMAALASI